MVTPWGVGRNYMGEECRKVENHVTKSNLMIEVLKTQKPVA